MVWVRHKLLDEGLDAADDAVAPRTAGCDGAAARVAGVAAACPVGGVDGGAVGGADAAVAAIVGAAEATDNAVAAIVGGPADGARGTVAVVACGVADGASCAADGAGWAVGRPRIQGFDVRSEGALQACPACRRRVVILIR